MPNPQDAEYNFVLKIDCLFPYNDVAAGYALVDEAVGISEEAVYAVMQELACIPYAERKGSDKTHLSQLLQYLCSKLQHPLLPMLQEVTLLMINDKELPVADMIAKMELLRLYKGMYSALAILYHSCDDVNGEMEPVYDSIIAEWQRSSHHTAHQ